MLCAALHHCFGQGLFSAQELRSSLRSVRLGTTVTVDVQNGLEYVCKKALLAHTQRCCAC
jgi:hypothetical protein